MGRPRWVEELALKRIRKLFEQAKEEFEEHPERSNRYMEIAYKISEKYNVPIPSELKKKVCSNCRSYWAPGETVKTRLDSENNRIIYICQKCGETESHGYSQEKKVKDKKG